MIISLADSKAEAEDKVEEVIEQVLPTQKDKIKKRFEWLQTYLESGNEPVDDKSIKQEKWAEQAYMYASQFYDNLIRARLKA